MSLLSRPYLPLLRLLIGWATNQHGFIMVSPHSFSNETWELVLSSSLYSDGRLVGPACPRPLTTFPIRPFPVRPTVEQEFSACLHRPIKTKHLSNQSSFSWVHIQTVYMWTFVTHSTMWGPSSWGGGGGSYQGAGTSHGPLFP